MALGLLTHGRVSRQIKEAPNPPSGGTIPLRTHFAVCGIHPTPHQLPSCCRDPATSPQLLSTDHVKNVQSPSHGAAPPLAAHARRCRPCPTTAVPRYHITARRQDLPPHDVNFASFPAPPHPRKTPPTTHRRPRGLVRCLVHHRRPPDLLSALPFAPSPTAAHHRTPYPARLTCERRGMAPPCGANIVPPRSNPMDAITHLVWRLDGRAVIASARRLPPRVILYVPGWLLYAALLIKSRQPSPRPITPQVRTHCSPTLSIRNLQGHDVGRLAPGATHSDTLAHEQSADRDTPEVSLLYHVSRWTPLG
jgi:hypothetical protein